MEDDSIKFLKTVLNKCNINFNDFQQLNGLLISRETLLNMNNYKLVEEDIESLKHIFSSSCMTCLQKTATKTQKWPLLNLVRQILKAINYKLTPIRKSDGYTKEGIKKYKRFFQIIKLKIIQMDISNVEMTNELQVDKNDDIPYQISNEGIE